MRLSTIIVVAALFLICQPCESFRDLTRPSKINFLAPFRNIRGRFQRPSLAIILQDNILDLERKVRASREEARQLRQLLSQQRDGRRKNKVIDAKRSVEIERSLQSQISELLTRIDELDNVKSQLETLLVKEQDHAAKVEGMLQNETREKENMIAKHRSEMDDLNTNLMDQLEKQSISLQKSKDEIARLTNELHEVQQDAKVALETEIAIRKKLESDQKGTSKSIAQEKDRIAILEQKLKDTEEKYALEKSTNAKLKQEQNTMEITLEQERLISQNMKKELDEAKAAVEKEKSKMRKLVKVLAEKEKKAVASSGNLSNDEITSINRNLSSKKARVKKMTTSHRVGRP